MKKTLTIDNPMYYKMQRMHKCIWGTKKEYKYYSEQDGCLLVPRGMLIRLINFFEKEKLGYIKEDLCVSEKISFDFLNNSK